MIKGYIINLYRKIASEFWQEDQDKSQFITFMIYDRLYCHRVSKFEDFFSIPLDRLEKEDFMYISERQKILLYSQTDEADTYIDIFNDQQINEEKPILIFTFLDFAKSDALDNTENMNFLQKYIETSEKELGCVIRMFKTLGVSDVVLIVRTSTFNDAFGILKNIKKCGVSISSCYSISAINRINCDKWDKETNLNASIRLSLNPSDKHDGIIRSIASSGAFRGAPDVKLCLGKYDYEIIGALENPEKLIKLFIDDGCLSPVSRFYGGNVSDTNTRLLEEHIIPDGGIPDCGSEQPQGNKGFDDNLVSLKKLVDRVLEAEFMTRSMRTSLAKLLLRLMQTYASVYTRKFCRNISDAIMKAVEEIYNYFYQVRESGKKQENKYLGNNLFDVLGHLNTLLDNRVLTIRHDFESPQQGNTVYIEYAAKLMLSYTYVVDALGSIFKEIGEQNGGKDRLPILIVDNVQHVCVNIVGNMPISTIATPQCLLFDIRYLLPIIIHETAHVRRIGWERRDRNKLLADSVFNCIYDEYSDKLDNSKYYPNSNWICLQKFYNDRFEVFIPKLQDCVTIRILESCKYKTEAGKICSDVLKMINLLMDAINDITADAFMIYQLDIKEAADYLNIMKWYYCQIGINWTTETIFEKLRIFVVLSYLINENKVDIGKIVEVIKNTFDSDSERNELECKLNNEYQEFIYKAFVEDAHKFLSKTVIPGIKVQMDALNEQKNVSHDLKEYLIRHYRRLIDSFNDKNKNEQDYFERCIDFIEEGYERV